MKYTKLSMCLLLAFSSTAFAQNAAREAHMSTPPETANTAIVIVGVQVQNAPQGIAKDMHDFATKKLVGVGPRALTDLNAVAAEMTEVFFKQRGEMFSRVYLPAQTISATNTVLTFAVLQGKLGKLEIEGVSPSFKAKVSKRLGVKEGDALNAQALERGLLLVEDFPGVRVERVLTVPGAQAGESDYTIKINQENPITGVVLTDNQGSAATGVRRMTAQAAWANPAGLGDELEIGVTHSGKGLTSARVSYSVPFSLLDKQGWKASVAVNSINYRLVGASLSVLDAHGEARGLSTAVTYPLIRSQDTNIGLLTQYTRQEMTDDILGIRLNDKRSDGFVLGASGDMTRNWFNSAGVTSINWSAAATMGKMKIQSADAKAADRAGPNSAGKFGRFNGSMSLNQGLSFINQSLSFYGAVTGQYAKANLDSSEKFVLTGPNAVRGYAQGEVTGDHGIFGTAELRYRLPQVHNFSTSLYGFVDQGYATIWAHQWNNGRNSQSVRAAGIGVTAMHKSGFFVTAATSRGRGLKDETSKHDNAFGWIQAGLRF